MADDKMKNDDLNKNLGGQQEKPGQQTPGRHQQDDEQFGQRGGQGGTEKRGLEDDELGQGGGRGGSNPPGQKPPGSQTR
ncbi:MAG TPA: hypothetical protein VLA93_11855 [Pyrinomonadaceae bacterium]|nr:hypothetical protein [Pyrinomonadaceae bacterium]